MAFSFELKLAISSELYGAISAGPEHPKAGHYTTWDAWRQDEKGYREINLGAESLSRPIENTIATLIHEMTHHYCAMAGIKDTSRGGTYHNKKFKAGGREKGPGYWV